MYYQLLYQSKNTVYMKTWSSC